MTITTSEAAWEIVEIAKAEQAGWKDDIATLSAVGFTRLIAEAHPVTDPAGIHLKLDDSEITTIRRTAERASAYLVAMGSA